MAMASLGRVSARRTRTLSLLGLLAIAEFAFAAIGLHAVSVGDEPSHMSAFARTRFWLVWSLGLYTLLLGCGALAWALRSCLPRTPWQRAGMALLGVAGLAALTVATFPVDEGPYEMTLVGAIHNDAALATFLALSAAMVALSPAFHAAPAWRSFSRASLALGLVVGVLGVVCARTTQEGLAVGALAQRALVGLVAAWFVLVALRLRRLPEAAPARPVPSA